MCFSTAPEFFQCRREFQVIAVARSRLGVIAPPLESSCKRLSIARAFVELGELSQSGSGKRGDRSCIFVVAYGAIEFIGVIACDLRGTQRYRKPAVGLGIAQHFDFAFVESQRSPPIFHCLEQLLE